jgi:tetratricopeptide (TPR) repeat protein
VIRPKASLLRTLALGRVSVASPTRANRTASIRALETHLETFPDDPTSAEVRWLLGRVRLEAGQRDQAVALWSAIPPTASRWIEARLALASLLRRDVETQSLNGDQAQIRAKARLALTFLSDAITQTRDPAGQDEFRLERIALQLLPTVAQPEEARQTSERLIREASRADQQRRARQMRIVALVELGRYLDADRGLAEAVDGGTASEHLGLARWLDRVATAADSDLVRRRAGQLLRNLASRLFDDGGELGPIEAAEARLRHVRSLLFSGDPDAARRTVERWPPLPPTIPADLLHDLADTYERLDVQPLAIDAYRLWMKRSQPGTLPWFAARYGLALAYERSEQPQEARQLIEATAILHPDLGGGLLRDRFERLRKRLK